MIDHVSIGVRDLAASAAFYDAVLAAIGLDRLVTRERTVGYGKKYPEFWINHRAGFVQSGDEGGVHVCLRARERAQIDAFHQAALDAGGTGAGAPGPRPEYSETYYAAFIRDPDGNTVEAVTF